MPAQPTRLPLPPAFGPAAPGPAATDHHLPREEREERGVQARLHTAIDGRPHALRLESSDA
ncbi:hypothetical protein Stsp01_64500 [Streptomyces sp. NBRC 13847]|uniref:hypothetical protein n=1 Tax=Streptomyces TaxID=1883 RepID=UPI0024A4B5A7|nr:hypothetical protein [Streptomyces sp. NBRC 13847]GLW19707.1 hypothetical protein Stsp01_64500 [Streptomyces sp. NBRC 13847]